MVGKLGAAAAVGWRAIRKLATTVPSKAVLTASLVVAITLGLSTPVDPPKAEAEPAPEAAAPRPAPAPPAPPSPPVPAARPPVHAPAAAPAPAPAPAPAAPAPAPSGKKGGITGTIEEARPPPAYISSAGPVFNLPLSRLPI
jgi:hypothetical protein